MKCWSGGNQQRRREAESTGCAAAEGVLRAAPTGCIPCASVCNAGVITAAIGVRTRTGDTVIGVCVTGAGSGGAIAHGHPGKATGEAGSDAPDCS